MWCTPVSILGPTTLVSLTLSGDFPTRPDQVYPVEPAVMLWAAGEDGAWIPCEPVGISGSARPSRAATLHYHFDTPTLDPLVAMRLDITYLGDEFSRTLPAPGTP